MRSQRTSKWLLSVFALSAFSTKAQEPLTVLVKQIKPAVVTIIAYDDKDQIVDMGSGFFIEQMRVITNWHVLQTASRGEIKTVDGKFYPIQGVVAEDQDGDLIEIAVDVAETVKTLQVTKEFPTEGEKVVVVGSPFGFEQTVSDGIVSALREVSPVGKVIQITAPFSPGSSGSPVVNLKGKVVGVATRQLLEGQNLNFAVPATRILTLLPGKLRPLAEWSAGTKKEDFIVEGEQSPFQGLIANGMRFLESGEYEKALPCFEKIVTRDPNIAEAWVNLGNCKLHLGHREEAIEAYKRAIRVKPDLLEPHVNLGAIYGNSGNWIEATKAYEEAVRVKPDDAEALFSLGWAYSNLYRWQEAMDACRKAVRINPKSAEAYYKLAGVYFKMDRFKEAVVYSKRALNFKPDYAEAYLTLGNAYGGLGRMEDEAKAYQEAIRLKPSYAEAHSNLGLTFARQHRWPEAIAEYKEAVRLNSDMVEAHYNLGVAFSVTGNKSAALDEYKILQNLNKELADRLFDFIYK